MSRVTANPSRRALVAMLVLGALVAGLVAGCGGSSPDARPLLDQAFRQSIKSANVTFVASATVKGSSQLSGPLEIKLSGPYQSNGRTKIPNFNWTLSLNGSGRSFTGALISTGDNAYLTLAGTSYEFGRQRVAQANAQLKSSAGSNRSLASFGINPHNWIRDAHTEGSASVAGTDTTHVRAAVDVARMLRDITKSLSGAQGTLGSTARRQLTPQQVQSVEKVVHKPTLDVYVAKSDKTVRRIVLSFGFDVPSAQQSKVGGLRSGTVSLSVELADVGASFNITAPPNPQPISQLLSGLGGLGGGSPLGRLP